jgi:hypothetical protein
MSRSVPAGRRELVVGLLILAALLSLPFLARPSLAAAAGHAIEGTVTAPGAAEEVEVCVVEPLPSETCTYPEPDGHYLLNGLTPGSGYLVEFLPSYRSHYVAQYYNGKPSPEGAQRVPVNGMTNTTGVDADLEIGGQIEGEASDAEGGGALAGVEVCALDATQPSPESNVAACARTDLAGEYRLPTLPPGTYKVGFWGAGESTGYLPGYYGDAPDLSTATAIVVATGTTRSGVDAELRVGARIAGTVTEADGNPVDRIAVCALTFGSGAAQRCGYSDATGHYDLIGLASGSYAVVFAPGLGGLDAGADSGEGGFLTQYYDAASTLALARPISLVAPAVASGIDASLARTPAMPTAPVTPTASAPGPAADPGSPSAIDVVPSPPRKCRKGFRRRQVKGRSRCVKVTPKSRHRKPRR